MKAILLLCLISLFSCNLIETGKCLLSKPKIKELGLKVIGYISTEDYSKIVPTILNSLSDILNDVIECFSKPKEEDDEDVTLLQYDDVNPYKCWMSEYNKCMRIIKTNPDRKKICYEEYCTGMG